MVTTVQFLVSEIIHPCPAQVLQELFASTRLQGEVLTVTGDGRSSTDYLVIRVHGVSEPVIVPSEKVVPHRELC
jgi:hypothetical protein